MSRDYRQELDALLEAQGGFYTYEDIMECIHSGKMQSFATENTWVVTQVNEFPRKKVIDIVLIVGDYEDLPQLESQLEEFRERIGADTLTATGRLGWLKKGLPGWVVHSVNFVKVPNVQ